jgi:uncharacterized phage protein (TIGR02220 family)
MPMKWFKHFSTARFDPKMRRLIAKFGMDGYGVYMAILESIAFQLETTAPIPDLEENSQDIAVFFNMDTVKVEEIVSYCISEESGLLQRDAKMLVHLDNTLNRNPEIRAILKNFKKLGETSRNFEKLGETSTNLEKLGETSRNFEKVKAEETRLEETRIDKKEDIMLGSGEPNPVKSLINAQKEDAEKIPYKKITALLNRECHTHFKPETKNTRGFIRARWNEGWRIEEFEAVIRHKARDWLNDPRMVGYLRPQTLFGTKFESYLQAARQDRRRVCPECGISVPYHSKTCSRTREAEP